MDKKEIKEKILILLENWAIKKSQDYLDRDTGQEFKTDVNLDKEEEEIRESSQRFEFINKQIISLRNWYFQLPPNKKETFKEILFICLKPEERDFYKLPAFVVLLHIGCFSEVLKFLKSILKEANQKEYFLLLIELSETLKYEWILFELPELKDLYTWINQILTRGNPLGDQIREFSSLYEGESKIIYKLYRQTNTLIANALILEIQLSFNQEINKDEQVLKTGIARLGFPKDLSDTLDKIDQKINSAADDFDFKGCMDLIRSFTERFYQSIAIAINSAEGKKMDEKDSEKVANFFIREDLISDEQSKILASLRHFMSNLGSHRLKSKAEDARLSRNMTIEFSLYILKRYNDKKSSN